MNRHLATGFAVLLAVSGAAQGNAPVTGKALPAFSPAPHSVRQGVCPAKETEERIERERVTVDDLARLAEGTRRILSAQ